MDFFRFFGPKLKEVTVSLSENHGSENPGMREENWEGANASARNGTGTEGVFFFFLDLLGPHMAVFFFFFCFFFGQTPVFGRICPYGHVFVGALESLRRVFVYRIFGLVWSFWFTGPWKRGHRAPEPKPLDSFSGWSRRENPVFQRGTPKEDPRNFGSF